MAKQALEDLAKDLISSGEEESSPPDDDWMNVFERYAEDASSERLQILWGRVLSGEVRKSGTFALSTMRFLSEADQSTVQLAQEVSKYIVSGMVLKTKEMDKDPILSVFLAGQDAGLVSGVGALGLHRTISADADGRAHLLGREWVLRIEASKDWSLRFPIISVTRIGLEISNLAPSSIENELFQSFGDRIDKAGIRSIHLGRRLSPSTMDYPSEIWREGEIAKPD